MSRIINLANDHDAQYANLLQNGTVPLSIEVPVWYSVTTGSVASGATDFAGFVYGTVAPATGDTVRYFSSSGASGSFILTGVKTTPVLPTVIAFTGYVGAGVPDVLDLPISVLYGYNTGSSDRSVMFGVVRASDPDYACDIFTDALGTTLSTGATVQYLKTDGSSGETVILGIQAGAELIPGFPLHTVSFNPDPSFVQSDIFWVTGALPQLGPILARRNAASQPRIRTEL